MSLSGLLCHSETLRLNKLDTARRHTTGPSHVSVGGHMVKFGQWGVRDVGMDPMMVRCGYDGPSSGSRSVT